MINKKKLFILVILFSIISIILSKKLINNIFLLKENFTLNRILFIDEIESYNNIMNSKYFNNLNKINLKARGCENLESCKKKYKANLIKFSEEEKKKLTNLIKHADDITEKFNKFYKVPWVLSKTTNRIENGFPFTIGNIIYISDEFLNRTKKYKLETIIHEKLHLYQRIYPKETQKLYDTLEFHKIELKKDALRRHNPDLDNYDYEYRGIRTYNKFNNTEPASLSDSNNVYLPYIKNIVNKMIKKKYNNEHPNEIFANIISRQIVKNKLENKFNRYLN
jgi:hypothetical protein